MFKWTWMDLWFAIFLALQKALHWLLGISFFFFFFCFYQSLHLSLQHSCPESLPTYLEKQSVLCLSTGPYVWLVTLFAVGWWNPRPNCRNHSPCEACLCEVLISSEIFGVSPSYRNKASSRKLLRWTAVQSRNVQFPVVAIWSNSQQLNPGKIFLINSSECWWNRPSTLGLLLSSPSGCSVWRVDSTLFLWRPVVRIWSEIKTKASWSKLLKLETKQWTESLWTIRKDLLRVMIRLDQCDQYYGCAFVLKLHTDIFTFLLSRLTPLENNSCARMQSVAFLGILVSFNTQRLAESVFKRQHVVGVLDWEEWLYVFYTLAKTV